MKVQIKRNQSELEVTVFGSLNTETAPILEEEIRQKWDEEIKSVVFDFQDLDYISSAGLRLLLLLSKKFAEPKKVAIINIKPEVKEVFLMTGFDAIIDIK